MATSEQSFQTELLHAFRAARAHAVNITPGAFNAGGVPDIYVKLPGRPGAWIELKYEVFKPSYAVNGVPLALTPLQRKFIRDHRMAGGAAGWALCVSLGGQRWECYAGFEFSPLRVGNEYAVGTRQRGELWPAHLILKAIIG